METLYPALILRPPSSNLRDMMRFRSAGAAALSLVLVACAASDAAVQDGGLPDRETRRREASPVRTVATSGADASFTLIANLAVDSRGIIYVPDGYQHRVTVLGPDGRLLRTFGRRGSGPDEFQLVQTVQVLPDDSLFVYDSGLGRASVYPPDSSRAAYYVNLGDKLNVAMPYELRRTHANDALLASSRPTFMFGAGQDFSNRQDKLRVLDLDGSIRKLLLTFPSQAFLVAQTSIAPHPFGHQGFAALDSRDRLHFVWSDTLAVARYDLQGSRIGGFRLDYVAPPLGPADVENAIAANFPGMARRMFESVLADSTPERWPAVRGLLIDDRDRLWIGLSGSLREDAEWAAFSAEGAYLGSVLVPAESEVLAIRADGTLYATRKDESEVPRVVVYRMLRPVR
jgi:hypothetical protein